MLQWCRAAAARELVLTRCAASASAACATAALSSHRTGEASAEAARVHIQRFSMAMQQFRNRWRLQSRRRDLASGSTLPNTVSLLLAPTYDTSRARVVAAGFDPRLMPRAQAKRGRVRARHVQVGRRQASRAGLQIRVGEEGRRVDVAWPESSGKDRLTGRMLMRV
ncbi:hypothetical protein JKP88DRAFT_262065 [Tribonema minus]|uniref:Uncharacterized protein n=1 Tax=Tribonema minus TaxID=303371 RepID=A0A835ZCL0_9STRA|nr:hypothetical protein JKP88DRAFT_262065 [Tribonema minus]